MDDRKPAVGPAQLALRVRELRLSAGYTQGALAAVSGVDISTIRNIELGRVQTPRTRSLIAIADALGVAASELGVRRRPLPSQAEAERIARDPSISDEERGRRIRELYGQPEPPAQPQLERERERRE